MHLRGRHLRRCLGRLRRRHLVHALQRLRVLEARGNACPTDAAGDCGGGYPNCTRCNVCLCDDDTCPTDATGDCDDGTNCLAPWIDGGMP